MSDENKYLMAQVERIEQVLNEKEKRFEQLVEQRIRQLEIRLEGQNEARRLQALELERRLGILNHAHEKAIEVQNTYLRQEVFDKSVETTILKDDARFELIQNKIDTLNTWQTRLGGSIAVVVFLVATNFVKIWFS
jgi:hypothetical protein